MYAMRIQKGIGLMHGAAMPARLKERFDHYEAAYYEWVVRLTAPKLEEDPLLISLLRFRVMKSVFFNELIKTSGQGLVTHLPGSDGHFRTALDARLTLLDRFPSYQRALENAAEAPVAYLPLIKLSEDPFSEILGQTLKLSADRSLITVKSGTGHELPTTMHETLHAAVRGLPGVFEEGFCRQALQGRGLEEDEMRTLLGHDPATLRANLAGIYYPNLLVNILSEVVGNEQVERAFFTADIASLDAFLDRAAGLGMGDLERPFRTNDHLGAAMNVEALWKAFGNGISARLKAAVESALACAGPTR